MTRVSKVPREANRPDVAQVAQQVNHESKTSDKQTRETVNKVVKYIDDYRSPNDIKLLREEGYEIDYDRLVGVGANSAVFLAHLANAPPPAPDKNGQKPLYAPGYDIAAKIVAKKWLSHRRPSKTRTGNLKLALALGQARPDHNILKVIDVFKTPERIFIFMQYCTFGNLISFIRRNGQVPGRLSQRWSSQMGSALSFLHKFHIAHRNYKLENVLIDENLNAKLTGFGLSKFCIDIHTKQLIMSKTICGSEPYLAPEMLKEAAQRNYDPKLADVWAFGVGVFLCVTRRYPFEADTLRGLKNDQLSKSYLERDAKKRLTPPIRELLAQTFIIDPSQRPSMQDLCNQSSWLASAHTGRLAIPHTGSPSLASATSPEGTSANMGSPQPNQHLPQASAQRTAQSPQAQPHGANHHQGSPGTNVPEEPATEHLSPVTPVAFQPTDALPIVGSDMPRSDKKKIERDGT